uniref:Methyl-CpG binding domain protein 6 n=1 Tax=Pelusios castaneus TaxID=367368 RepID=A0A8C8REU0_9SAUR
MNGGDEPAGGDPGGCPAAVPVGWQRKVEEGAVLYISPSGTTLTSLDQTRAYLLTDGTCKCGLECPLNMHKVFNFDPAATVVAREGAGARGDQDMTKLCNHRRKTVAMATLFRSMESAVPRGLPRLGPGAGLSQMCHSGATNRQQPVPFGRVSGPEGEGPGSLQPGKTQPVEKAPEPRAEPSLACPGDRPASTRPSQASSFPRHHSALFGDVFPCRTPYANSTSPGYQGHPAFPLQSFGLEPLDSAPRSFPLSPSASLHFPPPDEMGPPAAPSPLGKLPVPATPPPEGAPAWTSRACPLPVGASLGRMAAAATLSTGSSPGGGPELSPQRSRPTSAEPPGHALANQSSNNPPVPPGAAPEGKGPPGFLGLPLSQLLQPPGSPSFPASSLLSAAAKAQLASQRRADEPPNSTLPGRVLLSVVGGRALAKPPRHQRRSPTVLRLLKDSQQVRAGPEEVPTHRPRPREQLPGGTPPAPLASSQPLSSLLRVQSSQAPGLPLADGIPGLLPSCQDFNSQLLSLFSQLATTLPDPASGSPPQLRPGATPSPAAGAAVSPTTTKAASTFSPGEGSGGGLGCPLPLAPEPFPFLAQEQTLPFGGSLPPGLLQGGFLGSLPLSLALSPPQLLGCAGQGEAPTPGLGLQGDPEGQVLQSLLMASLFQSQPQSPLLPLGLPGLDLNLLPALLPLPDPPCQGDKAPEALLGGETFAGLPDGPLQSLLFPALPTPPTVLALNSALLAAGLAAPDAGPLPPQPGVASSPVAPTSTGTTPTTTEAPRTEGKAPEPPAIASSTSVPPSSTGRLNPLMPQLVSPLLSAVLLGDLSALSPLGAPGSPLLQNQPQLLVPALPGPLGLQLIHGQLGSSSPLACLLQLSPGLGTPEKPATAASEGSSPNPPSIPEPEPPAPFAPFCTDAASSALPSALDSPSVPRATDCLATGALEPAGPGQLGALGFATPVGQLDMGATGPPSTAPLKRARRSREGLNGDVPARGPPRRTKSARRGAGRGRGAWGRRQQFNGQAGETGEKAASWGHPPHPAWRCNGEISASGPGSPLALSKAEEIKGNPGRLRPSRRGQRRKVSVPRPSTRLETPRSRGPSTEPNCVPTEDVAPGRRPRPGRPAKNRRRKPLT